MRKEGSRGIACGERAWIEDSFIVVHCCLDEIKRYHLSDITEDVKNTNKKYREYLQKVELEQQS